MDTATLGIVIGSVSLIGAAATFATFWMRIGGTEAIATSTQSSVAVCHAKIDLLASNLADYKVRAAENFASSHELATAVEGLGNRFDRMADRLDRVLEKHAV